MCPMRPHPPVNPFGGVEGGAAPGPPELQVCKCEVGAQGEWTRVHRCAIYSFPSLSYLTCKMEKCPLCRAD